MTDAEVHAAGRSSPMQCERRASTLELTSRERAMLQGTWPLELLEDPARQPRVVTTAEELLREVLIGDHVEEFVLLPNGTELLDLREDDCLPDDVKGALEGCHNVAEFLQHLKKDDAMLDKYKAGIEYVNLKREQLGVLPKERRNLRKRVGEVLSMVEEGKTDPSLLYIAEFRLQNQTPHPVGGDKVKTIVSRDVKDVLGPYAAWTLYWDRHDEGVFFGNAPSGKGVHIDQVLWSNVGKNWRGYKLIAAWPKGKVSSRVAEDFDDCLFYPPLKQREVDVLHEAAKVVLVRPGDVYVFCGGIAHTVLCVSDEMCVSAYESFVSLHPAHVEHFLHTANRKSPYWNDGCMPDSELEDLLDETLDQLEEAARQLRSGGPEALPGIGYDASHKWRTILSGLRSDKELQSKLEEQFSLAVDLCMRNPYLRRRMPRWLMQAQRRFQRGSFSTASSSKSRSRSRSVSRSRSSESRVSARSRSIPSRDGARFM